MPSKTMWLVFGEVFHESAPEYESYTVDNLDFMVDSMTRFWTELSSEPKPDLDRLKRIVLDLPLGVCRRVAGHRVVKIQYEMGE